MKIFHAIFAALLVILVAISNQNNVQAKKPMRTIVTSGGTACKSSFGLKASIFDYNHEIVKNKGTPTRPGCICSCSHGVCSERCA